MTTPHKNTEGGREEAPAEPRCLSAGSDKRIRRLCTFGTAHSLPLPATGHWALVNISNHTFSGAISKNNLAAEMAYLKGERIAAAI